MSTSTLPYPVSMVDASLVDAPVVEASVVDANARRSPMSQSAVVLHRSGAVTALRVSEVVALGGLAEGRRLSGSPAVNAQLATNESRWVPAGAVWHDADGARDRPVAVGLSTGASLHQAAVRGLSDRLGWEAVQALDAGLELPVVTADAARFSRRSGAMVVLDGRLSHAVPTVVVCGKDFVRWGAAATWEQAVRRAMFGACDGASDERMELAAMDRLLQTAALGMAVVDLGSPALEAVGVCRVSVQLASTAE